MDEVTGKVAVITGGVSGIGLGIARTFVSAGMKVVITYMRENRLNEAMKHFAKSKNSVHPLQLDVTDRSAVIRAADETERVFGKVHILCNNAGVNIFGEMDRATFEDWDWILGVNLIGVINSIVTFVPRIKSHGEGGHIVNVVGMAGFLAGPRSGIYAASKFAVRGLSESLRYCLEPYNIGVSLFCPGLVNSNIYECVRNRPSHLANSAFTMDESVMEHWQKLQALGMDTCEAGKKVLSGVHHNALYIFSHPEFKDDVQARFESILAAFPDMEHDLAEQSLISERRQAVARQMQLIASLSAKPDCKE